MSARLPAPLPALAAVTALAALAACAPTDPAARAERDAARVPAATVLGEGQNCIDRSQIRQSVVRSDRVIDFEMVGSRVYRSTLPTRCPALGIERAITYETSINQLCTQDIVYVLQNLGGRLQRGAGCGLGPFVPVEYAPKGK
jgi:hypothetical protein